MQKADKAKYLETAVELARAAGPIALRYFRRGADVDNKRGEGFFDPVTAADREIEAFLRDEIGARFPDHGVIGEEHADKPARGSLAWVIDPIDGTRAFISGMPAWGIMIGLVEDGQPLVGAVHQPFTGEVFYGDGERAWLADSSGARAIASRKTAALTDAVLYCTHPSMFSAEETAAFDRVADACRMTRFGGDCYSYCLAALGEVDLVIESGLQPYDILPLIPILEGAGCRVTTWQGDQPLQGGQVIAAAHESLHTEAAALLRRDLGSGI